MEDMLFSISSHWRHDLVLTLGVAGFVTGAVTFVVRRWVFSGKHKTYPPGPPGIPFAGNLLQVPLHKPWLYFAKLGEVYGIFPTYQRPVVPH